MAIQEAYITKENVISIGPDHKVCDAVEIIIQKGIRALPVLEDGRFVGLFSLRSIVRAVLPTGMTLGADILEMDYVHGFGPLLASKLKDLGTKPVSAIMRKDCELIHPETSTAETLRNLYVQGSPLPVIDEKTGAFLGIVTEQSMLKRLKMDM